MTKQEEAERRMMEAFANALDDIREWPDGDSRERGEGVVFGLLDAFGVYVSATTTRAKRIADPRMVYLLAMKRVLKSGGNPRSMSGDVIASAEPHLPAGATPLDKRQVNQLRRRYAELGLLGDLDRSDS